MTDLISPEAHWRTALAQGRLLLQRSQSSGAYVFPPRVMAPGTGADDLVWVAAAGGGTVYAVTVISPKPPAAPYNVVLVDLDEGPRVMSRVEGVAAQDVTIGMRVKARIGTEEAVPILLFDPA
jgi:uncharacterized OB-fold protein